MADAEILLRFLAFTLQKGERLTAQYRNIAPTGTRTRDCFDQQSCLYKHDLALPSDSDALLRKMANSHSR